MSGTRERGREDTRGPGRLIRGLRADLATHADQWENPELDRYLGALAVVIEDLEGRFMNRGETMPTEPSWRLIAELLDAATVYE